jgi:asparagine synthase (glutamine-hydrolysing)
MLHVTPESIGETLPCYQLQPGLAITGDFRLDNREELLTACAVPRELWPSTPDSAIILLAYERWGQACVDHLLGDFAFAVWDEKTQRLFCARDFIGAKPFYYHAKNDGFYFASDITGLLAFSAVSNELDLRYARSYTENGGYYHLEFTFYEDVHKLPPAHTLILSANRWDRRRYWSTTGAPDIHYSRDEDYFEHLRSLLNEAVGSRLRSAYSIGSHVSGGLDSSAVAVLAVRALKERGETLHGFSWAPPPADSDFPLTDERALVEEICGAEGIIPIYTPTSAEDIVTLWTRDVTRIPETTLRHEFMTSRIAEGMGVRVMLSGWGGDEGVAFNGRGYFADLFRRGRWGTLTRELAMRTRLHEDDFWGNFKSRAILPLLPDSLVLKLRPELSDVKAEPLPLELLTPAFAARLSSVTPYPLDSMRERPGVHNYQTLLLNAGHLTERLEAWAVNASLRGMEYRYPLLDVRVVEFALGVPERLFHYRGWKRYLFRETTSGILPSNLRWNKYKSEPAIIRASRDTLVEANKLMQLHLAKQQPRIEQAGQLRSDVFLAQAEKALQGLSSQDHTHQVWWLAQLAQSS